jgi:hypothetical protein
MVIEIRFKFFEKETKGALRYMKVDEEGEAIEQPGPRSVRSICAREVAPVV